MTHITKQKLFVFVVSSLKLVTFLLFYFK